MGGAFARSFERPEDTTRFANGEERLVHVLGVKVGLATFEPGWRWSNDVRPLFGTNSCPVHHAGYVLSGRLHVEMDDGSTLDLTGGDACEIPSGHDAWVVGDEPCVMLDWGGKVRDEAAAAATRAVARADGGTR
jgi:mannose-6-phosphate isomerase-like protein (cupin superfamily)